jgi:hypothetical protein
MTPTIVGVGGALSPKEPRGARAIEKLLEVLRLRNRFAKRSSFCAQHDRSISFFSGGVQVLRERLESHITRF